MENINFFATFYSNRPTVYWMNVTMFCPPIHGRDPGMSPFTWNQSFLCSHTTLLLYVQSFCVAACLSRCLSIFLHTCLALQFIGLPPKGGLEDGDREGALDDVFKSGHCATIYYKYRGSSNSALSVQVCPFLN